MALFSLLKHMGYVDGDFDKDDEYDYDKTG